MMFYNGFNLLLDILLIGTAALWFHGVGFRKAKAKCYAKNHVSAPF